MRDDATIHSRRERERERGAKKKLKIYAVMFSSFISYDLTLISNLMHVVSPRRLDNGFLYYDNTTPLYFLLLFLSLRFFII